MGGRSLMRAPIFFVSANPKATFFILECPMSIAPKEIKYLQKALLTWYQKNHRKLPWRETKNPYRIWVSEVMLQQTQVKTVVSYYRNFIRQFPTIKKLLLALIHSTLSPTLNFTSSTPLRYSAAEIIL